MHPRPKKKKRCFKKSLKHWQEASSNQMKNSCKSALSHQAHNCAGKFSPLSHPILKTRWLKCCNLGASSLKNIPLGNSIVLSFLCLLEIPIECSSCLHPENCYCVSFSSSASTSSWMLYYCYRSRTRNETNKVFLCLYVSYILLNSAFSLSFQRLISLQTLQSKYKT